MFPNTRATHVGTGLLSHSRIDIRPLHYSLSSFRRRWFMQQPSGHGRKKNEKEKGNLCFVLDLSIAFERYLF